MFCLQLHPSEPGFTLEQIVNSFLLNCKVERKSKDTIEPYLAKFRGFCGIWLQKEKVAETIAKRII